MRSARVWKRLLGVEHTVIEQVRFDEDAQAVVPVSGRPAAAAGAARGALVAAPATTKARAAVAGGRSTLA